MTKAQEHRRQRRAMKTRRIRKPDSLKIAARQQAPYDRDRRGRKIRKDFAVDFSPLGHNMLGNLLLGPTGRHGF